MRLLKKSNSVFILLLSSILTSCASNPTYIDGRQYQRVDGAAHKKIYLLTTVMAECSDGDEDCIGSNIERQKLHVTFEECIETGLSRTAGNVTLLKQGTNLADLQKQADYSVKITLQTEQTDKDLSSAAAANSPIWAVGQSWTKSAIVQSRIFRRSTDQLVGELSAELTEDAYWAIPVMLVVPVPIPLGSSPNVEKTSCTEMGKALGRFFNGAGNNYIN